MITVKLTAPDGSCRCRLQLTPHESLSAEGSTEKPCPLNPALPSDGNCGQALARSFANAEQLQAASLSKHDTATKHSAECDMSALINKEAAPAEAKDPGGEVAGLYTAHSEQVQAMCQVSSDATMTCHPREQQKSQIADAPTQVMPTCRLESRYRHMTPQHLPDLDAMEDAEQLHGLSTWNACGFTQAMMQPITPALGGGFPLGFTQCCGSGMQSAETDDANAPLPMSTTPNQPACKPMAAHNTTGVTSATSEAGCTFGRDSLPSGHTFAPHCDAPVQIIKRRKCALHLFDGFSMTCLDIAACSTSSMPS